MAGLTNRGKKRMFDAFFRDTSVPAHFWIALCTNAVAPTADTNTFSQLTQIADGNGYSGSAGGLELDRNSTDFDSLVEDDTGDKASIFLKDITWTATGGNLPASGDGAYWVVLCDDNATVGSRDVLAFWSLGAARTVSVGQPLTIQDAEIDGEEPA